MFLYLKETDILKWILVSLQAFKAKNKTNKKTIN